LSGFDLCASIFREGQDEYVSSFSTFLRVQFSIYIEFICVIYALALRESC